jgi:hypothetical protein
LKVYDFPVASRTEKGILTETNIKDYFNKKKKVNDTALNKYASFHFLIYLAKKSDVGTAESLAKQIYYETLDPEIIEAYLQGLFGYN